MGALQKIRSQSTLLVVTIAIGLICFIVPWHEVMNIVNLSKNKVFQVNGQTVKVEEYLANIQGEQMIQEAVYGQLNETQMNQLRESVYESMVADIILKEQAEKVGITIPEDALASMIKNVPQNSYLRSIPFFVDPQTGQFSQEAFNQFLTFVNQATVQNLENRQNQEKLKNLWTYIQYRLKATALQSTYTSMLYRGLVVNNLEIENYKTGETPESNIDYVKIDNSFIKDSEVEVSEAEIKKLYESKNKNLFEAQYPTKVISYFVKEITPSETDYAETLEQAKSVADQLASTNTISNISAIVNDYSSQKSFLNAYVSLNDMRDPELQSLVKNHSIGDVVGPIEGYRSYNIYKYIDKTIAPDSISVQILPLVEGQQATTQFAVNFADSLLNVVKAGKSFEDLAKELMPNQSQVYQELSLTEPMLATAVENPSSFFNAPAGSVHQVYIQNRLVLMNIVSKSKPVEKYKIATINISVDPSNKTYNDIDNEINTFIAANNSNVANFDRVALEKGYDLISDVSLQSNFTSIKDIPGSREVIRWAFDDEKSNKDITRFELGDLRLVALVTGSTESGLLPVTNKQINERLKDMLLNQKKSQKLKELLASDANASLEEIADKYNSKINTAKYVTFNTSSIDYPLNVWSKYGSDKRSNAIIGDNSVFVMSTLEKVDKSQDLNENIVRQSVATSYGMNNGMYLFQIFNEKAKIKDNRLKFNF